MKNKHDNFLRRERAGWDDIEQSRFCSVAAVVGVADLAISANAADNANENAQAGRASQEASAGRQAALAEKQDARAEQAWQRYRSTYALEDQMVDEARGAGSRANQDKAAADSAAAVSSSFANARERLNKNPGVNPSSQQYQQEASKIGLAEAATSATAQTSAREAVKDRALAAQTNAVSLGKGLPASAVAGGNSAGAIMGSAGDMYVASTKAAREQAADVSAGISSFAKGAAGIYGSKGMQDWINSSDRSWNTQSGGSYGSAPGGYVDSATGTTYNNPSAYVAP